MPMRVAFASLVVSLALVARAEDEDSRFVAVFPLVAQGKVDVQDAELLTEVVRNVAGRRLGPGGWEVLTKENQLSELKKYGMDEQAVAKACEESKCEVDLANAV